MRYDSLACVLITASIAMPVNSSSAPRFGIRTSPHQQQKNRLIMSNETERIPLDALEEEVALYEQLRTAVLHEWSTESLKYEGNLSQHRLPRRNFMNVDGIVQDTGLYPYDSSFYPLLDAYDQLYTSKGDDPYFKLTTSLADEVPDKFRPFGSNYSATNTTTSDSVLKASESARVAMQQEFTEQKQIPARRDELISVLLKVLCHCCSDLQRDLELAVDIFKTLLGVFGDEHIWALRRLFVTIDLFYSHWMDFLGDEGSEVFEAEMQLFLATLGSTMKCMQPSRSQIICLAGFVRWVLLRDKFTSDSSTPLDSGDLKQRADNVRVAFNPLNQIPKEIVVCVCSIFCGSMHAKNCVFADVHDDDADISSRHVETYLNSIDLLVSVGLSLLQMVQFKRGGMNFIDDQDHSQGIGSVVSVALCRLLCKWKEGGTEFQDAQTTRLWFLSWIPREFTLQNPLCFANCILNATSEKQASSELSMLDPSASSRGKLKRMLAQPPRDVLEVVRGLFLHDLANPLHTGFGYGEFLLWCGYQVKPFDGMIFW